MRAGIVRLMEALAVAALIIVGCMFISFVMIGHAQTPPLPPGAGADGGPITNTVLISWDRNPASDYYLAVDTNGVPVPLVYRVRMATNITTPWTNWTLLAATTNTTARVTNLVAANMFFTVTASNFFLESAPSRVVSIPRDPPSNLHLIVE